MNNDLELKNVKMDYRELRGLVNKTHARFSEINFDQSLSLQQKVNLLAEHFKNVLIDFQTLIDYIDDFMDKFDENLYNTLEEVLNEWLASGKFDKILNDILALTGDLSLFRKFDKTVMEKINNEFNEQYGNPIWYGADPTGQKDSYKAIQECLDNHIWVKIPKGIYSISQSLVLRKNQTLEGKGFETILTVANCEQETSTLTFDGIDIKLRDITLDGNGNGTVLRKGMIGITFKSTYRSLLENVRLTGFMKTFDEQMLFMTRFHNVSCSNCLEAFVFTNNVEKTSLDFVNCWTENCGQSYRFYKTFYSSFTTCGADYCNYVRADNPYDNRGVGSKETHLGIYNFDLCRGITLNSIAGENSYGNGLVRITSSSVIINGLVATNIFSDYKPTTDNNKFAMGLISIGGDKTRVTLNNIAPNNRFVSNNHSVNSLIAYNYDNVYGINKEKMVILQATQKPSYPLFLGQGNLKDCLYIDDMVNVVQAYNYIDLDRTRIFTSKAIDTPNNKLVIPFKSNVNTNYNHLLKINLINNENNTTNVDYEEIVVEFITYQSITGIKVINKSNTNAKVTANGLDLIIEKGSSRKSIIYKIELISQSMDSIDFENIKGQ